ncbi:MAG: MBL fold metallo-hydrolase [Acidobacteria bacterium]|nr:MBL fold metallo-hydrolase [Acidobacteriota bacterium]
MNKALLTIGILVAMSSLTISQIAKVKESNQLPTSAANSPKVTLTYFGAAGWEITDGKTVILLDPLLSRPRYKSSTFSPTELSGDTRPVIGPTDPLISDSSVIDAHVKRADFILVHHTHFDHMMDVPYIARKTGAFVLGTESTTNVARANGVLEEKLITIKGGEDFEFGSFSLRIIPSLHWHVEKACSNPGIVPRDIKTSMYARELVEGGSLAYLLRFNGHQILTFGSMNYIEKELEGASQCSVDWGRR